MVSYMGFGGAWYVGERGWGWEAGEAGMEGEGEKLVGR